jgi:hypothetical protein
VTPEPAIARIEPADSASSARPVDRQLSGSTGPGGRQSPSEAPSSPPAGAAIRAFRWLDENEDVVGGYGEAGRPDGTKDQHFRLELDLPPASVIEELVITSGGFHRWVTKPSARFWPIAIFQNGQAIARSHVPQVGAFAGPQTFDLYFNTGIGIGPGAAFELEVIVSIGGTRHSLTAVCRRH